jgi:hypothetical protein
VIYFIANLATKALKIGTADDPWGRLRQLQTAADQRLEMVAVLTGDHQDEGAWHRRWRHLRRHGEWFAFSADLFGVLREDVLTSGEHPEPRKWHDRFLALARIDSTLLGLMRQVASVRVDALADGHFCANALWYGYRDHNAAIKGRVLRLAGWQRWDRHPDLSTTEAYDVVYDTIYRALPDCRSECACQNVLAACLGASG